MPSWPGGKSVTVIATVVGSIPTLGNEIFNIFITPRSYNESKHGIEFRH